jgi:hypothetical protein
LGRALEAALSALADLDNNSCAEEFSPDRRNVRSALVEQASVALWHFIVQREACGLHDMRHLLRDYGVPAEVAARVGAIPSSRSGRGRNPR